MASLQLNAIAVDNFGNGLESQQARIEITVIRNSQCPIYQNVPALPAINESISTQTLITLADYVLDSDPEVNLEKIS